MTDLVFLIERDVPFNEKRVKRYRLPGYLILYRLIVMVCCCYCAVLVVPDTAPDYYALCVALCIPFFAETGCMGIIFLSATVPQGPEQNHGIRITLFYGVRILLGMIIIVIILLARFNARFYIFACIATILVDGIMEALPYYYYYRHNFRRTMLIYEHQIRNQNSEVEIFTPELKDSLKSKLISRVVVVTISSILLVLEYLQRTFRSDKEENFYELAIRIIIAAIAIAEIVHYAVGLYRARPQNRSELFEFDMRIHDRSVTRLMFMAFPLVFFPLAFDSTGISMLLLGILNMGPEQRLALHAVKLSEERLGLPYY